MNKPASDPKIAPIAGILNNQKPPPGVNITADVTSIEGIIRSPRPIRYAALSCFDICSSLSPTSDPVIDPPIPSLIKEYPSFLGTITIIGILPSTTPSASVSMCFVLYTEIASYMARRIRRIITGRGSSDIPNIEAIPAASNTPSISTTYHSGYFHRINVAKTEATIPA